MSVSVLMCSKQLMHIEVKPVVGDIYLCTVVYGASSRHERGELFRGLDIACVVDKPWLVLGDFNCKANFNEPIEHRVMNSEIQPLKGCMMNCGLHDIWEVLHMD